MQYKKLFILIFFALGLFLGFSQKTLAADLYFTPPDRPLYQGDSLGIAIYLNSDNETINAAQIDINFSPEFLEILSIDRSKSLFNLWPRELVLENRIGLATIIGGLPTPGFIGNELVGIINFRAKSFGETNLVFGEDSRVLLNDGKGTEAKLERSGAVLKIIKAPVGYEAQDLISQPDSIPPESFNLVITKTRSAFNGQYFVIFGTIDNQSGISHYEIREIVNGKIGDWKIAASPEVLQNQEGKIVVQVKAVDRAGNEITSKAEVVATSKKQTAVKIIIVAILIITVVWIVYKRRTRPNK